MNAINFGQVHAADSKRCLSNIELRFDDRESHNLEAKRGIADAAYRMLKPHSTVFLDAGTTVLQLARRLRIEPLPLTVFTNGLAVAQALLDVPKVRVNVLGGQLRNENASVSPDRKARGSRR